MNEQQQAEALARWLEQPVGTPAPEGLDPEVLESIYALQPERAPAPTLSADDILGDVGAFGSLAVDDAMPGALASDSEVARTTERRAQSSANRLAGFGALLATAATLLLFVGPSLRTAEMAPGVAMDDRADAPSSSYGADPYVTGAANELEVDQGFAKKRVDPKKELAAQLDPNDAVADAMDVAVEQSAGAAPGPYERQQMDRFEGVDLDAVASTRSPARAATSSSAAPAEESWDGRNTANTGIGATEMVEGSVAAEYAEPVPADGWADDAVVALDEEEVAEDEPYYEAERAQAEPAAAAAPYMVEKKRGRLADKPKLESGRVRADRGAPSQTLSAPEADAPTSLAENLPAAPPAAVTREQAVPRDYSANAWRNAVDGTTLARMEQALQIANAEVAAGSPGAAADLLDDYVGPPSLAGQTFAGLAARWYLQDGQISVAASTARRGLALSSENTAVRSQLLLIYGDILAVVGDRAGSQSAYSEAAVLNAAR